MKKILKKIADKMKIVFGYSILITLFVGGLTFFGYLAALLIGGEVAARICDIIYNTVIPYMIYATNITVLFGLLTMYLAGEMALTAGKSKKDKANQ